MTNQPPSVQDADEKATKCNLELRLSDIERRIADVENVLSPEDDVRATVATPRKKYTEYDHDYSDPYIHKDVWKYTLEPNSKK
jgi:hypothetical protein